MNDYYENGAAPQIRSRATWRAKAVVAHAAVCGVVLLVLITHYPRIGWVLLPWLIAFGWSVGEARNSRR